MKAIRVLAIVMLSLFARPASAGDGALFDQQFADAWAQCRDALYQSNPAYSNPAAAAEALGAFSAAWERLAERWAAHPPPQYAKDAQFGDELKAVSEVVDQATGQAGKGHVAQAHATLGQVRALLAEMRRKNGIELYTDQLDAFDDKLAEAADDDLDQPELTPVQFVELCEQVGVLGYLAERLEKRAPAGLAEDDAFLDLVEELARQVRGLKAAVLSGQRAAVVAALSDLRRNFDRLYLLYG